MKCLEDVFARRLDEVLKTFWRRLEDLCPRRIYWSWPRRLEDVLRMSSEDVNPRIIYFLDEDVLKTSSEDEGEKRLEYVFNEWRPRRMFSGLCVNLTDCYQYLRFKSNHAKHTKRSIIYSQTLRASRTCSQEKNCKNYCNQMRSCFLNCGFLEYLVGTEKEKGKFKSKERTEKNKPTRCHL